MPANDEHQPLLGIDLGTTFSAIARWAGRGPEPYETEEGKPALQSAVYVEGDEILVGELAFRRGLRNSYVNSNLALGFKRDMGTANKVFHLGGRDFTPIDLSALVLKRLHSDVKKKFPEGSFKDRGVVVTVPYYFKAHELNNTRLAVEAAGLDLIELVPEPVAASLLYAWDISKSNLAAERNEKILVFDLGGGTFDVTVFELKQTTKKLIFQVISTNGDAHLGGMDFDERLMELALAKAEISLHGLDPKSLAYSSQRLRERAIEAKHELSTSKKAHVTVDDIRPGTHLDVEITRAEFEESISGYVVRIREIVERVLADARVRPDQLDRIVKVGGSSRVQCMTELLEDLAPRKTYESRRVDLCVAEGAAMFAAFREQPELLGREIEIQTVNNHDLGVEISRGGFDIVVPKNRRTPCENKRVYKLEQDGVSVFTLKVYQGSSSRAKENTLVGEIPITGLPSKKAGEIDMQVTFKVGADQTLSVAVDIFELAKDASGKLTRVGNGQRWESEMRFH